MNLTLREAHSWLGRVQILATDKHGRILRNETLSNLIVDCGRDLIAEALRTPGGLDVEIKYLAFGTGTATPLVTDTKLGAEVWRKALSSQAAGAAAGEVESLVYVDALEGNYAVKELGWFAGTAAGTAADSGVLLARVLWDHTKTAAEALQIVRTDSF